MVTAAFVTERFGPGNARQLPTATGLIKKQMKDVRFNLRDYGEGGAKGG